MLIHSIVPMELLQEQPPLPICECKAFSGGYVEGYADKDGFVISRIISTDPSVYLQKELSPGEIYR